MEILIKISQLIPSLSILIIFHELGHFIPAKIFKIHIERFFLFFDPWFALFKKKIGSSVYGIGWLPFGGYVKISGMTDENLNEKKIKQKYYCNKFYSQPAWKRLIIMLGGVIVNIILSIIIFSSLIFKYGEIYLPIKNMKYGISVNNIGNSLGLINGDIVYSIDGKEIKYFQEIPKLIILCKFFNIKRDKKNIKIFLQPEQKKMFFNQKRITPFMSPRIPIIIKKIIKKLKYKESDIRIGDKIIGINYKPIFFVDQISKIIDKQKNNNLIITINRGGMIYQKNIKINKNDFDIFFKSIFTIYDILQFKNKKYNLLNSIIYGLKETWESLNNQIGFFKQIFNTKTNAYKQIGSFLSITQSFSPKWDFKIFWLIIANLSIWLSFLNILPIPSLDGGYVFFTLIEMIKGEKLKKKLIEKITTICFMLLSLLMIIILIWDIYKNVI